PRDALGRHPRRAVRLSCLSDRTAPRGHALDPLDAALRFRPGGRGAPLLARRSCAEAARPGALLQRRGRRCVTLSLLARQCAADIDVPAAVGGLRTSPAAPPRASPCTIPAG